MDHNNISNDVGQTTSIPQIENYLDSFPPGYKFDPTDEELITKYLLPKIDGAPLPINLMHDVNIYNHNPEHLAENYKAQGNTRWYFFTSRDKKYLNGQRPNRKAGEGYWKATGADKDINSKGVKVGYRKALVFYKGNPPHGLKTLWIMHEFRSSQPSIVKKPHPSSIHSNQDISMRLDDFVLCRIYKKNEAQPRKNSSPTEQQEVEENNGDEAEAEGEAEPEDKVSPPVNDDDNNIFVVDNNWNNNVFDTNANIYDSTNNNNIVVDNNNLVKVYNPSNDNNITSLDDINMYRANNGHNTNINTTGNVYNAMNNTGVDYPYLQPWPLINIYSTDETGTNSSFTNMNNDPLLPCGNYFFPDDLNDNDFCHRLLFGKLNRTIEDPIDLPGPRQPTNVAADDTNDDTDDDKDVDTVSPPPPPTE